MTINKLLLVFYSSLVYFILRLIVVSFKLISLNNLIIYSNVEFIIIGSLATISLFYVAFYFTKNSKNRTIFLLFGFGNLLWNLGDISWAIIELILHDELFPSIADFFWIVGYIPILVGLILRNNLTNKKLNIIQLVSISVFISSIAILSYIFIFREILEYGPIYSIETVLLIAYPLSDFLLVSITVYVFSKYDTSIIGKHWLLFGIALFVNGIGDIIYSYEEWNETYNAFSWTDHLLLLGYLLTIIFAMSFVNTLQKSIQESGIDETDNL